MRPDGIQKRGNRGWDSVAIGVLIRHRKVVIAVFVLVVLLAGYAASRLRLNADFVTYLDADNALIESYYYVGEIFGGNETGIVLVTAPDVYQPEILALVDVLTDTYQEIDGIEYASSLTNTLDFAHTEWGIEVGRVVRRDAWPTSPDDFHDLRQRVENNPRISGNLVSIDGTVAVIQLRYSAGTADRQARTLSTVQKVLKETRDVIAQGALPENATVQFGGMPFLMNSMAEQISENMGLLVPLMLIFIAFVLFFGLRHWTGVVFPLVIVLVSSIVVLGTMSFLGLHLDMLSALIPVILIILGSADGIHYMKRYYERRQEAQSAEEAAADTYREIKVPLILTTATTMIAFASLALSEVTMIRNFGLLTAFGLFIALVATLVLLPSLTAFGAGAPSKRKGSVEGKLVNMISRSISRAPRAIISAGLLVIITASLGTFMIVKSVDWTLCLEIGSSPHRSELLLREKMGGSLPMQMLVKADLMDPATLVTLRSLERRLEAQPSVSKSQSVASLIAEMNAAVNGYYAIPDTREGVTNLWFLIEEEKEIAQLVTGSIAEEGLVQARVADWETPSIHKAVAGIDDWLNERASSVAVLDIRKLRGDAARDLGAWREQNLIDQIQLLFGAYGIESPLPGMKSVVRTFEEWIPDQAARSLIDDVVKAYISSPESEIDLAPDKADRLASILSFNLNRWGLPAAEIESAILESTLDAADWEREAAARSLELLTFEEMGRYRIEASMSVLEERVPALQEHSTLSRNVRGAFREAHNPLTTMPESVAARLDQIESNNYRRVPLNIGRSGLASVLKQMEDELLPTQLQSIFITLIIVFLLLAFLFRSNLAGLLIIVPLSGMIAVSFGTMGFLSIGLDSFTAMVASIAIGLGVDYAIHFTYRFRSELGRNKGRWRKGLRATMNSSGVAILINALSIGGGFMILLLGTCQHIRRFGGLTSLAMIAGGVFTLVLLPALYLTLRPRFLHSTMKESDSS